MSLSFSRVILSCCFVSFLTPLFAQEPELQIGYAVYTLEESGPSPVASALFRLANSEGIVVSEAGVPAVRLIQRGRIFVQEDAARQTGVALVSLADEVIDVRLILREASGQIFAERDLSLQPRQHTARFVRELFEDVDLGISFEGSLTLQAAGEKRVVGAVTLRQSLNALQEAVFTTLPVADLDSMAQAAPSQDIIFPQIGVGRGLSTQLVLINGSDLSTRGTVRFFTSEGEALQLQLDSAIGSEFPFTIDSDGTFFAELLGLDPSIVQAGYAVVEVEEGPLPSGSAIFRFVDGNGIAISEAGVGAGELTTHSRILIDNFRTQTGLAIANTENRENRVEFDLLDASGTFIETTSRTLPAQGHLSIFANELFDLTPDFVGLMEIRSESDLVPISLKLTANQRSQSILTTLPVADLQSDDQGVTFVLPQVAFGLSPAGDFSTRLSMISADLDQPVEGVLGFWTSDGQPWKFDEFPGEQAFAVGAGERGDIRLESTPEPFLLARGNSSTVQIGPEGGSISVENQFGDIITLRVPPRALLQTESITVTALTAPPGRFFATNVFPGVLLEPEGLVFNQAASLEVRFASSLRRPEVTRLSWVAGDRRPIPAGNQILLEDAVEAEIDHFSVFTGDQWTLADAVRYLGILLDPDFQDELRQLFPDFKAPRLDDSFLELLATLEVVDAVLELERLRDALGADENLTDFLALLEEGALRFLESDIPAEPCAEYHSFLREFIRGVQDLLDSEIIQDLSQRLQQVDDECISVDLTGRWIVESFDAGQICRIIEGCPSTGACRWEEDEDEPPLLVDVVQQESDFLISFPEFPQVGFLGGGLQATGTDFQPYSFTVEDSSSTTLDCMIFFQSSGLGIDFGAPLCPSGTTCTPLQCQETVTVTGLVSTDGNSFLGFSFWDFFARVRESSAEGPALELRYRCRGSAELVGEKIE